MLRISKRCLHSSPLLSLNARAAVSWSPGSKFAIENVVYNSPKEDELVVRIVATGICHTDIAVLNKQIPSSFPVILGHEGVGIVEWVGSHVSNVSVGDSVVLSYSFCGTCKNCSQRRFNYCYKHRNVNFIGERLNGSSSVSHRERDELISSSFFGQSSFSTLSVVRENNVIPFKAKRLELPYFAPLGCGVQTGAGAVLNTLKPATSDSICVIGCGGVGLSSVIAAKLSRCSRIVSVDPNQDRIKIAHDIGADAVEISLDQVDEMFDFVIDTTGIPSILRQAFNKLNPGGTAVLLGGSKPGAKVEFDMLNILLGRSVRGVIQGDSVSKIFLPQLIEKVDNGEFPIDRMIRFYDGLESIEEAAQDMKSGSTIKPVIRI